MAQGDPWRVGGGVYVNNPRMLFDTDEDGVPDDWTLATLGTAVVNAKYFSEGFSDQSAWTLNITHNGISDSDSDVVTLTAAASPAQSIPIVRSLESALFFLSFRYLNSAGLQRLIPVLTFYNADESQSYTIYGNTLNPANTGVAFVEATNIFTTPAGSYPGPGNPPNGYAIFNSAGIATVDHLKLQLRIGYQNPGVAVVWSFDDFVICYSLITPRVNIYDTLSSLPLLDEFRRSALDFAEARRGPFGQMRVVDATGGAEAFRMECRFARSDINDYRILGAAHRLCRGRWIAPQRENITSFQSRVYRLKPQPIVLFPFTTSPDYRDKFPEAMYAWMTTPWDFSSRSGLAIGIFEIPAIFEEP